MAKKKRNRAPSLTQQLAEVQAECAELRQRAHRTEADAGRRRDHIKLFKAERTALDAQVAELRGYVVRVLEDDRAREGIEPKGPGMMEVEHAHSILRKAEDRPVYIRRGPPALFTGEFPGQVDYGVSSYRSREAPTPWQDRD